MAAKRYRLMYKFWLDIEKPEEEYIADLVELLKNERAYSRTIREGISLICDLRAGKLDALFALFPWVKAEFLAGLQSEMSPVEKSIEAQLARLEELMREQGNSTISSHEDSHNGDGSKALAVPEFAAPTFDDDDDLVLDIKPDTHTNASENFINSMLSLTN